MIVQGENSLLALAYSNPIEPSHLQQMEDPYTGERKVHDRIDRDGIVMEMDSKRRRKGMSQDRERRFWDGMR
jgi:hypothetical protein